MTQSVRKIITCFVYPSIPDRRFDWSAHFDGQEEYLTGRGAIEHEAIDDLLQQQTEKEDGKQSATATAPVIPPHSPKVATVESKRQRRSRQRAKWRRQARMVKLGAVATGVMMVAVMTVSLHAQEVATVSASLLADAPRMGVAGVAAISPVSPVSHPPVHHFLDRANLTLFSMDLMVRLLDAQSTRANLTNPCACYKEDATGFASSSTMGQYGYSIGVVGGLVGVSYLAHRLGRHRLERLVPMVDVGVEVPAVVHNYAISGKVTDSAASMMASQASQSSQEIIGRVATNGGVR